MATLAHGIVGDAVVTSAHGIVGDLLVESTAALRRCFAVSSSGDVGSFAQAERPTASKESAATVMRWRIVVMAMS